MNKKLVLIDADGLLYHSSRDTIEESLTTIDEKINNILEKTEATHYSLFISQGKYFRHLLFPEYKQNRKSYPTQLKWIKTLRQYLVEKYNAMSMNGVEADDLLAYWYNKDLHIADDGKIEPKEVFDDAIDYCQHVGFDLFKYEPIEVIIASPDKDILQSILGKHFNYTYRLEDKDNPESVIKGWWVETNKEDAYDNFWKSVITGDNSDGIKGLEGAGDVAANKIIKDCKEIGLPYYESILRKYITKYGETQGIFEFQKNYRLLHLLDCDEDFYREVRELPELPHINEVSHSIPVEKIEINNSF
jgi:5'-3' exonuclease